MMNAPVRPIPLLCVCVCVCVWGGGGGGGGGEGQESKLLTSMCRQSKLDMSYTLPTISIGNCNVCSALLLAHDHNGFVASGHLNTVHLLYDIQN